MLIHARDDTSFLRCLLNVYNTETKILQLFNCFQGGDVKGSPFIAWNVL